MEGENNILHSHVYETIKYDFELKIENILLSNAVFKLNNYTNKPDHNLFDPKDKRYVITSKSKENDKIEVYIKIKSRHDEIKTEQLML